MTLIETGDSAPAGDPRPDHRLRRPFRLLRVLEDLAAGRVGLLQLPGAAAERPRKRRPGRR